MVHLNPKFDVVTALRLRGMKVLSAKNKVINIDKPTRDLRKHAIDIIENTRGIRTRSQAVQFNGFCIRWNEAA